MFLGKESIDNMVDTLIIANKNISYIKGCLRKFRSTQACKYLTQISVFALLNQTYVYLETSISFMYVSCGKLFVPTPGKSHNVASGFFGYS